MEEKMENMSSRKLRDYMSSSLGFTEAVTCRFSETAEGSRVELISEPTLQAERRNGDQWVWEECMQHSHLADCHTNRWMMYLTCWQKCFHAATVAPDLEESWQDTLVPQVCYNQSAKMVWNSQQGLSRDSVNMKIFWISADVKTKPAFG
jgi:hypothetical protein